MTKPKTKNLTTGILYWLGLPTLVTIAGYLPGDLVSHSTLLILYLITVLFSSLRANHMTVMACAVVSFILFNFFHTAPKYSLLMLDLAELISAIVFIGFAFVAGGLAFKIKTQVNSLELQKDFLNAQLNLGQQLQLMEHEAEILPLLNDLANALFPGKVAFSLQPAQTTAADIPGQHVTWTTLQGNDVLPAEKSMLDSLGGQVNGAIDRLHVSKALQEAKHKSDEDRLRSALLSSVSHDLKTPLVTMIGAATSLRDLEPSLSHDDKRELLLSIISESRRLESYIQNLLDMTRLGHGALPLRREWVSIDEIYHVVMKRIGKRLSPDTVLLKADDAMPNLHVHAALVEQALFNAIDNALKASGEHSGIEIAVSKNNDMICIRISDQGPGLPESEWEAVFDQFYTFSQGDCYEKGTGLGLSICRSIFRVHGGDAVIVPPPPGFNHCLLLTLPLPTPDPK